MRLSARETLALVAVLMLAGGALAVGWNALWFLTDDAYIAFRYVSNSLLGHGYVWNPPPFRPVEGYTSFLWLVLLEGVWRGLGVEPPRSANWLSLLFSFGSLCVAAWLVLSLPLRGALRRARVGLVALVLLGVVSNRSFLTWSSSGLETALFDFLVLLWVACATGLAPGRVPWVLACSASAALLALARPDGLLFAAATALGVAWGAAARPPGSRAGPALAGGPLLAVPAHLLWRHARYGEWLPNTYFAKVAAPWPESGLTYAASFVLEYALWIWWIPLIALAVPGNASGGWRAALASPRARAAAGVVAVLAAHVGYYTFVVGGDHFEYRVYSHLVVLFFVSFAGMLAALTRRTALVATGLLGFALASWPVAWSHWALLRERAIPPDAYQEAIPLAPHWPAPLRGYVERFDELQAWLAAHFVAMPRRKHELWTAMLASHYPSREEGLRLPAEGFPVLIEKSVGVAAWSLPRVNVLDYWGLNDYVIARNPVSPERFRTMAHDRVPPPGYAECFAPNVRVDAGRVEFARRERPLGAEDIAHCEGQWAARMARAP